MAEPALDPTSHAKRFLSFHLTQSLRKHMSAGEALGTQSWTARMWSLPSWNLHLRKKTVRHRKEGPHPPTLHREVPHYHIGAKSASPWPFQITRAQLALSPGMQNPQIQMADRNHCSMSFYIMDLSILKFWSLSLQGLLEPISHGYWGMNVPTFY